MKAVERRITPQLKRTEDTHIRFECGGILNLYLTLIFFKTKSIGTTFYVEKKYEYIKQIGHGAYGVVCSATDKEKNSKVAIKKVYIKFYFSLYD